MIDLHMHLDGALEVKDLKELADIEGLTLPSDYEKFNHVSSLGVSLNDFLRCFKYPSMVTQSPESLYRATQIIMERMKKQGILYVEIRYSPQLQTEKGMSQEESVKAVMKALNEAEVPSSLILCFMRHSLENELNYETLDLAAKYLHKGVEALDLAGAEGLYSTDKFSNIFAKAYKLHIPFTIHAGEADTYKSVDSALSYHPNRIGHGVHALENEETVKNLVKLNMPLEVCVTSEIQTHCVPSLSEFPLRKMLDKGLNVTINTDDESISCISLASEYRFIKKNYGITKEESKAFMNHSIDAAFCDANMKKHLHKELDEKFEGWYKANVA